MRFEFGYLTEAKELRVKAEKRLTMKAERYEGKLILGLKEYDVEVYVVEGSNVAVVFSRREKF